jgi:hypothetical protein
VSPFVRHSDKLMQNRASTTIPLNLTTQTACRWTALTAKESRTIAFSEDSRGNSVFWPFGDHYRAVEAVLGLAVSPLRAGLKAAGPAGS